ncbi:MAG: DNA starvation/stationary phase protection protein [Halobacteriovoraceae bacterium]|nr:DNA starvation/stationary phase protection protein [Halobacteriovoraceae bacterium]|tara:strand:+ start:2123 stop:2647 length:525 start_codon:yes stop_codon:yes gene_type:complete
MTETIKNKGVNLKTKNFERPIANLNKETAGTTTKALNTLLANEYAVFTKTLNYHWNVTGPRFHSIHNFLETQYRDLLEIMDNIAERVRIIGETPISTVEKMKAAMDIDETNGEALGSNEMLDDLLFSHMKIQTHLKEVITNDKLFENDPGTEDFLVGLLQKHESMSWMLKSHLD